jgi:hypothetical protein
LAVPAYQQGQVALAQLRAFLLGVTPLGQCRAIVIPGNRGQEIRGIGEKRISLEVEEVNDFTGSLVLDGLQGGLIHQVHLIPAVLAGELCTLHAEAMSDGSGFRPRSNAPFGAWLDGSVHSSEHEGRSYR